MEDSEKLVETVLAGLRDAEIPAGLEARLLHGVQNRRARQDGRGRHRRFPAWAYLAFSAGAVCAVLVLTVLEAAHVSRHTRDLAAQTEIAPRTKMNYFPVPSMRPSSPKQAQPLPFRAALQKPHLPAARPGDARPIAMESRPAPPLPLTHQEQLLIALARQRNAAVLQLLNPDMQNRQLAQADEQFRKFFAPPPAAPPPLENKTDTEPGGSL